MNILFISKFPTLLGLTPCKCQKVYEIYSSVQYFRNRYIVNTILTNLPNSSLNLELF